MTTPSYIDLGAPACLGFRGPDAVRYLNGQLTQDVRRVPGTADSLSSCATDAKGRFQFRVWITELPDGTLAVDCPGADPAALEARLTRYLIADEVEAADLTGRWSILHFTGPPDAAPPGVVVRSSARFGAPGTDWWIPAGAAAAPPADVPLLAGDALEAFRIARGVPLAGRELTENLLPPEAGLDATDISYQKGCYIGQEVISRIRSAGKVRQRLARFVFDADPAWEDSALVDAQGAPAGALTSVSPLAVDGVRRALGFVRRGVDGVFLRDSTGGVHRLSEE